MLLLITDRVQAVTTLEGGIHVIPPFESLEPPTEAVRQYTARVVAVMPG